jgi:ferredoxin
MKYCVEVDRNTCIACGVCYSTDPSHFESDAVGKSLVVGGISNGKSKGLFTDELQEDAQRATDSCPIRAISIK